MKKIYPIAFLALVVLVVAAAGAYASSYSNSSTGKCDTCYVGQMGETNCTSCAAVAWDRRPIYVVPEGRGPCCPPNTPTIVQPVDPWARCGAFCYAGQIPQGWPWGWCSDYWSRPDSNF